MSLAIICREKLCATKEHVKSDYQQEHIQPSPNDWGANLRICEFENSRLGDLRRTARTRLVDAAAKFVSLISNFAEDADLHVNVGGGPGLLTGDPAERPLVMTGHQPVIFHPGLSYKYALTEAFTRQYSAIGVAVVIDTDYGDAGQFSYPAHQKDGSIIRRIETLSHGEEIYQFSSMKKPAETAQVLRCVTSHLSAVRQNAASARVAEIAPRFESLASSRVRMLHANLIMRRAFDSGRQLLEIPFSSVASFPECLRLTADILKQPLRFANAYNSALQIFRAEHGIRNAANPFPELKISDGECELPFWVISSQLGKRSVLKASVDGNVTRLISDGRILDTFDGNITAESLEPMLSQNIQVVPRGGLITAFLRLLFADIFVHGSGGGRYDRFTDEFIRLWWNVEPPPFTIATASRHLFTDDRAELKRLLEIEGSLRDLRFNPQRHLGTGVFSEELEMRLKSLIQQKKNALADMQQARSEEGSGKQQGMLIQQITVQIRDAVSAEFEEQLSVLHNMTPEHRDALECRTWPSFLFDHRSVNWP